MDTDHPGISEDRFKNLDWKEFYQGAEEHLFQTQGVSKCMFMYSLMQTMLEKS